MALDGAHRLVAVHGGRHLEAGEAQAGRQQLDDVGLVVDHQQPGLGRAPVGRGEDVCHGRSGRSTTVPPRTLLHRARRGARTWEPPERRLGAGWSCARSNAQVTASRELTGGVQQIRRVRVHRRGHEQRDHAASRLGLPQLRRPSVRPPPASGRPVSPSARARPAPRRHRRPVSARPKPPPRLSVPASRATDASGPAGPAGAAPVSPRTPGRPPLRRASRRLSGPAPSPWAGPASRGGAHRRRPHARVGHGRRAARPGLDDDARDTCGVEPVDHGRGRHRHRRPSRSPRRPPRSCRASSRSASSPAQRRRQRLGHRHQLRRPDPHQQPRRRPGGRRRVAVGHVLRRHDRRRRDRRP